MFTSSNVCPGTKLALVSHQRDVGVVHQCFTWPGWRQSLVRAVVVDVGEWMKIGWRRARQICIWAAVWCCRAPSSWVRCRRWTVASNIRPHCRRCRSLLFSRRRRRRDHRRRDAIPTRLRRVSTVDCKLSARLSRSRLAIDKVSGVLDLQWAHSCSNKSVFALSSNGLCFGNQIDLFNVFIYTFTVHPSCQRIFDFLWACCSQEKYVVYMSTTIW